MNVPAGSSRHARGFAHNVVGLPIGLQVVGLPMHDAHLVLSAAHARMQQHFIA